MEHNDEYDGDCFFLLLLVVVSLFLVVMSKNEECSFGRGEDFGERRLYL